MPLSCTDTVVVILTQDSWVTGVTLEWLKIWKNEDKNPSIEEDIFPKIAIAECKWFANIVWSDAMMQVQIDRWFADTRKVKV